jgi:hypothetical protein
MSYISDGTAEAVPLVLRFQQAVKAEYIAKAFTYGQIGCGKVQRRADATSLLDKEQARCLAYAVIRSVEHVRE